MKASAGDTEGARQCWAAAYQCASLLTGPDWVPTIDLRRYVSLRFPLAWLVEEPRILNLIVGRRALALILVRSAPCFLCLFMGGKDFLRFLFSACFMFHEWIRVTKCIAHIPPWIHVCLLYSSPPPFVTPFLVPSFPLSFPFSPLQPRRRPTFDERGSSLLL